MALFDRILGEASASSFTVEEAVAAVLFLTVSADGNISDEEKELFVTTSNRMKLLKKQTVEEYNSMMDKIRAHFNKHGFDDTLSHAVQFIPAELRDTTFALSADIIFADGSVDENESLFIESVQKALQIPDNLALQIVEVMQIKNKG